MMALNDPTKVAFAVNLMSAIFSALTVYIVFHLIYLLAKNVSKGKGDERITILGAATGGLCLTFSDSFWFSAVEAETYAAASFFLMLLVGHSAGTVCNLNPNRVDSFLFFMLLACRIVFTPCVW